MFGRGSEIKDEDDEMNPKLIQYKKLNVDSTKKISAARVKRRSSSITKMEIVSLNLQSTPMYKNITVEGTIKVINILDTKLICMCFKYTLDGLYFAVGFSNGLINIYTSPQCKIVFILSFADSQCCSSLQFSNKYLSDNLRTTDVLLASHIDGIIKLWHYDTQTCLFTIDENRPTLFCSFSSDATKFISSGNNSIIHVYDLNTCKLLSQHQASYHKSNMDGHRGKVFVVKYHPNSQNSFVSGGWDNTLQFWDDRAQHASRHISGPHICGEGLDIDPENDQILTGSWRKSNPLQVWDYKTGKNIRDIMQIPTRTSQLYCVQFVSKNLIATSGYDNTDMRIIDRNTNNIMGRVISNGKSFYAVDNDRAYKPIYGGICDTIVYLFQET
ncbi:hypothetical protein A3Q56_01430 [Intoshia linei]|uniref:Uncharacterized protein n=1 Tax=Intoshia linei TaxID=1819745 RepID=A0A177BBB6_9BILA|nr:hypothetical protein A3Q56_01430 [Intoshia linei]